MKEWAKWVKETEKSTVCTRRLREVVLTIVGTVILWTRDEGSLEQEPC